MLDAHLVEASNAKVLLKISEMGSFTATAAALGVSQPSISQQVKRIERLVGCTLFVRGRLGVSLTSDGEAVDESSGLPTLPHVEYAMRDPLPGAGAKVVALAAAISGAAASGFGSYAYRKQLPHNAPDPVRSDHILGEAPSM